MLSPLTSAQILRAVFKGKEGKGKKGKEEEGGERREGREGKNPSNCYFFLHKFSMSVHSVYQLLQFCIH